MKSNSNVISTDGSQLGLPGFTNQILKLLLWSAASWLSRIQAAGLQRALWKTVHKLTANGQQ